VQRQRQNDGKKWLYRGKYCDSMVIMLWKIRYIGRVVFLFFYAIYAFTPIHLYAMADHSGNADGFQAGKRASTEIVWINVLFSSLFDDDDTPSAPARISAGAQHGGVMVLIKKRRTVFREQFDCKPRLGTKFLPRWSLEPPAVRSAEYEVTKDPLVQETDGCLSLNSGLSPPSLLS